MLKIAACLRMIIPCIQCVADCWQLRTLRVCWWDIIKFPSHCATRKKWETCESFFREKSLFAFVLYWKASYSRTKHKRLSSRSLMRSFSLSCFLPNFLESLSMEQQEHRQTFSLTRIFSSFHLLLDAAYFCVHWCSCRSFCQAKW